MPVSSRPAREGQAWPLPASAIQLPPPPQAAAPAEEVELSVLSAPRPARLPHLDRRRRHHHHHGSPPPPGRLDVPSPFLPSPTPSLPAPASAPSPTLSPLPPAPGAPRVRHASLYRPWQPPRASTPFPVSALSTATTGRSSDSSPESASSSVGTPTTGYLRPRLRIDRGPLEDGWASLPSSPGRSYQEWSWLVLPAVTFFGGQWALVVGITLAATGRNETAMAVAFSVAGVLLLGFAVSFGRLWPVSTFKITVAHAAGEEGPSPGALESQSGVSVLTPTVFVTSASGRLSSVAMPSSAGTLAPSDSFSQLLDYQPQRRSRRRARHYRS